MPLLLLGKFDPEACLSQASGEDADAGPGGDRDNLQAGGTRQLARSRCRGMEDCVTV